MKVITPQQAVDTLKWCGEMVHLKLENLETIEVHSSGVIRAQNLYNHYLDVIEHLLQELQPSET